MRQGLRLDTRHHGKRLNMTHRDLIDKDITMKSRGLTALLAMKKTFEDELCNVKKAKVHRLTTRSLSNCFWFYYQIIERKLRSLNIPIGEIQEVAHGSQGSNIALQYFPLSVVLIQCIRVLTLSDFILVHPNFLCTETRSHVLSRIEDSHQFSVSIVSFASRITITFQSSERAFELCKTLRARLTKCIQRIYY